MIGAKMKYCPQCQFTPGELDIFKILNLPEGYPERMRWQNDREHRRTLEFYAWHICAYAQARVLDVGAGPGTVAIPLSRLDNVAEVVCFDVDEEAQGTLCAIKQQENLTKLQSIMEGHPWNLPFANESFDVVVCRYAMHHFEHQAEAMRDMVRCLKPGGLLLYSDPAMPEHSRNTTHGLYLLREDSFYGYRTYHEMTDLVRSEGLETLTMRSYDYQRGTLDDFLKKCESEVKEHLIRAWCGLDEQTKRELKWSGKRSGPFITYPIIDIAALKAGIQD
jgi:SAM-dependent methyltransferase